MNVELSNCANCGKVFAKSVRDICHECYKKEEEAFRIVYRFLSKRKNREATLSEIVKATGVEEELIIKFIKQKRLRTSQFPKLAYPCEQCGVEIVEGKLCSDCAETIRKEYERHELRERLLKEREEREHDPVYYSIRRDEKDKK